MGRGPRAGAERSTRQERHRHRPPDRRQARRAGCLTGPVRWSVIAALPAVLLLAACVPAEQPAALQTATTFQQAVRQRDGQAACDLIAPEARDRLEAGSRQPCPAALTALDLSPDVPGSIAVWGDNAQLRLPSGALFLAKFRSGWKVTAAGCRPRPELPYACAVAG